MHDTTTRTNIRNGMEVYGNDEEQLGTVAEVGDNYVLVQKGLIFVKDIYIPVSAIDRVAGDALWLNIPKDQVESMGWDDIPTEGGWDASDEVDYGRGATGMAGTTGATSERDRIQVHEEELEARKVTRQAGEVEVRKDVVEEHQSMDVPVTREEVRVRRVPVDRDATPDDTAFRQEGDTIRVPVMEEDVEVRTRPRVTEEIEIEKVARQDTKQASGTVRKERVDVSGAADDSVRSSSAGYTTDTSTGRRGRADLGGDDEAGTEAVGAGAGALGGAADGGAVGGPPGAVIGGVVGAAGGALAGEAAEGDDEAGSAAGGAGGTLAGAAIGGAVAGPPGAVVGGAVGAGAGAGVGDEAEEEAKGQEDDR